MGNLIKSFTKIKKILHQLDIDFGWLLPNHDKMRLIVSHSIVSLQ